MMKRMIHLLVCVFLMACAAPSTPIMTLEPTKDLEAVINKYKAPSRTPNPVVTSTPTHSAISTSTSVPEADPNAWKTWPVIPSVDASVRDIYNYGQSLGNDPHAFSIFG